MPGILPLHPHKYDSRHDPTEKQKKPKVTNPFEFVTSGVAVCTTAHGARGGT